MAAESTGMPRMFGTNGVRGIVNETLTPELALKLGKAVGSWLKVGDSICIGTDARRSRDMLKGAFCAGIHATGVNTVDVGVLASPGIQIYGRDHQFAAGAIITASHNPPIWNGIKLTAPDGTETNPEQEEEIEAFYFDENFRIVAWDKVGAHGVSGEAKQYYIDSVLKQVDQQAIRAAKLKIVLDPGGGAGCVATPDFLRALNVEFVPISCELDGAFSDRPSEPTEANSAACIAAVKAHQADFGFLMDGDADRSVFIDENGGYIWGDTSLALAAKHELPRHENPIFCTAVSSGSCVKDAVESVGGQLNWTVVGSPKVAQEMIRLGAVFGGEDNGGMMFARHQLSRDALMALGFILETVAKTGRTMSDLCSEIPKYCLVKEKVQVPEEKKAVLLDAFKATLAGESDVLEVDDRDGVKCYVADGWVLVRPSGTEPIFRVQGEAKTDAAAAALVGRFKALFESCL
jgi:phosphomannomutase/phosphoglucomutase